MNLIITIIEPPQLAVYTGILKRLGLRLNYELHGRGTASKHLLERLGIESKPKYAVISSAGEESSEKLMKAIRRELYIDAPGNGICVCVPIKSVGGAKTLEYLQGNDPSYMTRRTGEYESELIVAIANEGFSEQIMDAARAAGARGGTILHAKGTARGKEDRFYNVTISEEKELILIVAATGDKAAIMKAIIQSSGPATQAGAITFSLPVSGSMGVNTGLTDA